MERTTISFVCLSGIFAKMSFAQNNCLFFLCWISFVHRTCVLLDILGICFEGARDSLLLLICCYIVLLVFGEEPSFCPTCLLCQHFLDSFCFVFVFCLNLGALLLWSFAEVCFFVLLIFLILGCCFFAAVWSCWFFNFMSWLRVLRKCGFWCFHFVVTLLGGRSGRANREGSIYFWAFS